MGFSPGEFKLADGRKVHWEGRPSGITLWTEGEKEIILQFDHPHEVDQCVKDLSLLADLYIEGRL